MLGDSIPWAVIISLGVLCFAFFIRYVLLDMVEDEDRFVWIIVFFFIVYVGAAFAVGSLNPVRFVTDGLFASDDSVISP